MMFLTTRLVIEEASRGEAEQTHLRRKNT